jgi:hypothetical protein
MDFLMYPVNRLPDIVQTRYGNIPLNFVGQTFHYQGKHLILDSENGAPQQQAGSYNRA